MRLRDQRTLWAAVEVHGEPHLPREDPEGHKLDSEGDPTWLDAPIEPLICTEKRRNYPSIQTYHLAVVLLDNFLARKPNLQKQVAQVIAATTLFIASKLE